MRRERKKEKPHFIQIEQLSPETEDSSRKGIALFLRIFLMGIYTLSLHHYLCEALHLSWNTGWWQRLWSWNEKGPYIWQFLSSREQMANSFYHLENLVIDRLSYAMDRRLLHYITTIPLEETLPMLIGLLMIGMSLLFFLVYGKRMLTSFWVLLHIVILSIPFLFRETPSFWNFFILLGLVLAMESAAGHPGVKAISKAKTKKQPKNSRPEYRYIGAALVLLLTMVLSACLLPEKYFERTSVWLSDQKASLTEWGEQLLAEIDGQSGRFPTSGKRFTDKKPVMDIRLKWPEEKIKDSFPVSYEEQLSRLSLYLKDYAAIHYGSRGWEGYTPEEEQLLSNLCQTREELLETQLYPGKALDTFLEEASVRTSSFAGQYYPVDIRIEPQRKRKNQIFSLSGAPDFGLSEGSQASPVYDLYATGKGSRIVQEFSYDPVRYERYTSFGNLLAADYLNWGMASSDYREFVFLHCLELPENLGVGFYETVEEIQELAEELWYAYPASSSAGRKELAVKLWLSEHCTYDLEPGTIPEGRNMVEYFLTESRRGYCVHFASAAVLLLRAMGVPARYAEGYLVSLPELYKRGQIRRTLYTTWEEDQYVRILEGTITGESAHAWAEVWMEDADTTFGIGFVPMEFTVGTVDNSLFWGFTGSSLGHGENMIWGEEEADGILEEEETDFDTNPIEPVIPELPDPVAPEPEKESGGGKNSKTKTETNLYMFLPVLLLILLPVLSFFGIRGWQKEHYRRMDARKKVLYWYKKLEQLHLPAPPTKSAKRVRRAKRIAQKARFSELEMTNEDVRFLEGCYLEQKAIKNVKKG